MEYELGYVYLCPECGSLNFNVYPEEVALRYRFEEGVIELEYVDIHYGYAFVDCRECGNDDLIPIKPYIAEILQKEKPKKRVEIYKTLVKKKEIELDEKIRELLKDYL